MHEEMMRELMGATRPDLIAVAERLEWDAENAPAASKEKVEQKALRYLREARAERLRRNANTGV